MSLHPSYFNPLTYASTATENTQVKSDDSSLKLSDDAGGDEESVESRFDESESNTSLMEMIKESKIERARSFRCCHVVRPGLANSCSVNMTVKKQAHDRKIRQGKEEGKAWDGGSEQSVHKNAAGGPRLIYYKDRGVASELLTTKMLDIDSPLTSIPSDR